eukprot:9367-Heterococcus_DN1.PRE.5
MTLPKYTVTTSYYSVTLSTYTSEAWTALAQLCTFTKSGAVSYAYTLTEHHCAHESRLYARRVVFATAVKANVHTAVTQRNDGAASTAAYLHSGCVSSKNMCNGERCTLYQCCAHVNKRASSRTSPVAFAIAHILTTTHTFLMRTTTAALTRRAEAPHYRASDTACPLQRLAPPVCHQGRSTASGIATASESTATASMSAVIAAVYSAPLCATATLRKRDRTLRMWTNARTARCCHSNRCSACSDPDIAAMQAANIKLKCRTNVHDSGGRADK